MSADKAAVERELEEAWTGLAALVASLPEDELERPGVVGAWSVKDLLGHIAFWAEKAAEDLQMVAGGRAGEIDVPGGEAAVDEWIEREYQRRKDRSLARVQEEWLGSYQAARQALNRLPAERLDEQVKGWAVHVRFAVDMHHHYREHAEHIRAWRRRVETTEA